MSLRVVVQEYLSSMRERDELDALLPELLAAMGHQVLSKPQAGVRQGGIDCLSSSPGGQPEAFLFVIKFGDIGRSDYYDGPQAIEPSIREACSDYLRTRLPASLQGVPKRFVLVTNGELKQTMQQNWAGTTEFVAKFEGCTLELWNQDTLTSLVEQHLLDSTLLLGNGAQHLRKAVSGLDNAEFAVRHFTQFVDAILDAAPGAPNESLTSFERRCRAAAVGWVVFNSWCRTENNLKPALLCCEYLLLKVWAGAIARGCEAEACVLERVDLITYLYLELSENYYKKVAGQLMDPAVLVRYAPDHAIYAELVMEEFGRFGSIAIVLAELGRRGVDTNEALATVGADLEQLIGRHPGCHLPVYDGQTIDLSLALIGLSLCGKHEAARVLAKNTVTLLGDALRRKRFLPISSDSLEDYYAVSLYGDEDPLEYFRTSTLVPMLGSFASASDSQELLDWLHRDVLPQTKDVTLERWYPTAGLERGWGREFSTTKFGVSRALAGLGINCREEQQRTNQIPEGAATPDMVRCTQLGVGWLLAMGSRHFRHPIAPWYFLEEFRPNATPPTEGCG